MVWSRVKPGRGWRLAVLMLLALTAPAAEGVDGFEVHLWPVIEHTRLEDGKYRTLVLFLYHRTTNPDGSTYSLNWLGWIRAPRFTALAPFFFRIGAPGAAHTIAPPLWFSGPGYKLVPPLASGAWRRRDGGWSWWLTPLAHLDTAADGSRRHLHVLTYVEGPGYQVLLPLAWRIGPPGRRHLGVLPLWFAGPRGWSVPLALSARWRREDGATLTWLTPLFHRTRTANGERVQHLLTWFSGRSGGGRSASGRNLPRSGYEVLFPLGGRGWETAGGVTRAWTAVLPALSARWPMDDGGVTTWITPLFHRTSDGDGRLRHLHALTWFQGVTRHGSYRALLPLFYRTRANDGTTRIGALPLWLSGPGYRLSPALLSGRVRRADGGSSTWITPLAHVTRDGDGRLVSRHLLTWVQAGDLRLLLPIAYRAGPRGDRHFGVLPLWFQGRDYRALPLALSWWHRRADGSATCWLTPLFHRDRDPAGRTTSLHALAWFQGRDWRMLLPLWFSGRGGWTVPLTLSGRWRRHDGGSSAWFTPLVHVERDARGAITGGHALTWFHGRGYDVVAPLAWRVHGHRGVLPFWLDGPRYAVCPPLLSGRWWRGDGGSTTWYTPLTHRGRDGRGHTTDWHLLSAWRVGRTTAVLPLFLARSGAWAAPLLLLARWSDHGRTTTVVTPLIHRTTAGGEVVHQHLLNWVWTPRLATVFPLWWSWRDRRGDRRSLGLPLWYQRRSHSGERTTTVFPALFSHRRAAALDATLPRQLVPFLIQRAGDGSEVNVLWRLYHQRRWLGADSVTVGPLWWSERRTGEPARWQILGGLVGRDNHVASHSSRCYALWIIPLGARRPYAVAAN